MIATRPSIPGYALVLDGALVVLAAVFTALFVSGIIGAYADLPLFSRPVELCLLMLAPIVARVHVPDFVRNGLRSTIALVAAHLHLLLPFAGLILINFATAILPGTYLPDGDYKPVYILVYRLVVLAGAMSLGIFLWPAYWRWIVRLVLFIAIGSVLWDVAHPGPTTFSENSGRAAGFQENPNEGALVVIILAAMAIRYRRVAIIDLIILFLTFVAVFATLSRGGILLFGIIVANYLYFTGRGRRLQQIALAPAIVIGGIALAHATVSTLTEWSGMFTDANARDRLAILSFDDTLFDEDESRLKIVPQYLALIEQAPILGHGTGFDASLPVGPHNTYLQYWVNNGLLGLVFYCWFLGSLLIILWRRGFIPGLVLAQVVMAAGLFFHDLPGNNPILILAGLAAGISWCEAVGVRSTASVQRTPSAAHLARRGYGR